MKSSAVNIRVPATSANLGPGFDSLGLALGCFNSVTTSLQPDGTDDPFLLSAAEAFFKASGRKRTSFQCLVTGDVPRSRGMGSSVTVRLGLLHGLNQLTGLPLNPAKIIDLCVALEGHPDNTIPAALGGFVICRPEGGYVRHTVGSKCRFVLLIPERTLETKAARKVLPARVGLTEAAISAAGTALIGSAFASRDYESLRGAFADHFHQPYRKKLLPFLDDVITAGVRAGAVGGWLSGSGSTIACLALERAEAVARAMRRACPEKATTLIVAADNRGVRIPR